MDNRAIKSGAAVAAPSSAEAASVGYFTAGDPVGGTPAAKPGPYWFHQVGEELRALIVAGGLTPDKAVLTQVRDAVNAIIGGGTGQTVQTTTLTGTQDNFAATSARRLVLRCNNATLVTFTGFAAGSDGDVIDIISVGVGDVAIADQGGTSTAANRAITGSSATLTLTGGIGTARLIYDATTARWRVGSRLTTATPTYPPTLANVINTVTKTAVVSATIPANDMAHGDQLEVTVSFLVKNNKGSSGVATLEIAWGGTTYTLSQVLNLVDNATEQRNMVTFLLQRVGADLWILEDDDAITRYVSAFNTAVSQGRMAAPTFTSAQTLALNVTLNAANATFYLKPQEATIRKTRSV